MSEQILWGQHWVRVIAAFRKRRMLCVEHPLQALLPQCAAYIACPTTRPVDAKDRRPLRDRYGKSEVSNRRIEHIEARPQATGDDARYSQFANTRLSQLKYNPETHPLALWRKSITKVYPSVHSTEVWFCLERSLFTLCHAISSIRL